VPVVVGKVDDVDAEVDVEVDEDVSVVEAVVVVDEDVLVEVLVVDAVVVIVEDDKVDDVDVAGAGVGGEKVVVTFPCQTQKQSRIPSVESSMLNGARSPG